MESNKTLVIWFKNGKTAIFEQVENLDAAEKAIVFDYYGKSTETKRSTAFFLANIAGFAESV
ncbi:TPA: hypothetical protein ACSY2V_14620 [Listeria monocytogenes]|nr:hypothetical protein [Listeria monocytogenes]